MEKNKSEDINLLEIIKFLYDRKIFITIFTIISSVFFTSIVILATISKDRSYNISVSTQKSALSNFNRDLSLDKFISIKNLDIALRRNSIDLDAGEIIDRISIIPGGKKLNNLQEKLMTANVPSLAKELIINEEKLESLLQEIHGFSNDIIDFNYLMNADSKLSPINVKKIIITLIKIINEELSNYHTDPNTFLNKEIKPFDETYVLNNSNKEHFTGEEIAALYIQSLHSHIIQNERIIKNLNENYGQYNRDLSLKKLLDINSIEKNKFKLLINRAPKFKNYIISESTLEISKLYEKISSIDLILNSLSADESIKDGTTAQIGDYSSGRFDINEDLINVFLNLGTQLSLIDLKKSLLEEKKELLFMITEEQSKVNEIKSSITFDSDKAIKNVSDVDLESLEIGLRNIGSNIIPITLNINEYINSVYDHVISNNSLNILGQFFDDKKSILNFKLIIYLFLISISSLIIAMLSTLKLNNNKKNNL